MIFIIVLIFSLPFVSCSDENVGGDKFVNAYVDLRIAEDTLNNGNNDFQKAKVRILKKYGLTEEQYNSAFEYFSENPESWEQFYDKVIARVDTLKKRK
jgi:hypothetical protein